MSIVSYFEFVIMIKINFFDVCCNTFHFGAMLLNHIPSLEIYNMFSASIANLKHRARVTLGLQGVDAGVLE